jgi:hypothetical protein
VDIAPGSKTSCQHFRHHRHHHHHHRHWHHHVASSIRVKQTQLGIITTSIAFRPVGGFTSLKNISPGPRESSTKILLNI